MDTERHLDYGFFRTALNVRPPPLVWVSLRRRGIELDYQPKILGEYGITTIVRAAYEVESELIIDPILLEFEEDGPSHSQGDAPIVYAARLHLRHMAARIPRPHQMQTPGRTSISTRFLGSIIHKVHRPAWRRADICKRYSTRDQARASWAKGMIEPRSRRDLASSFRAACEDSALISDMLSRAEPD